MSHRWLTQTVLGLLVVPLSAVIFDPSTAEAVASSGQTEQGPRVDPNG